MSDPANSQPTPPPGPGAPPLSQEVASAFAGIWAVLKRDDAAPAYFNLSVTGFWRSFIAAGIMLPVLATDLFLTRAIFDTPPPLALFLPVEFLMYVISWTIFPLVMIHISRLLDRQANFLRYIVPYNWFQCVIAIASLPGLVMLRTADAAVNPSLVAALYQLVLVTMFVFYNTYLAKRFLDIPTPSAFGIVVLDVLIGLLTGFIVRGHFFAPYMDLAGAAAS